MKNIFYLVRYLNTLLNKHNYFKSDDQITDALHWAQLKAYNARTGNERQYQPGRPVPPLHYQVTTKVSEDLRPFLKTQKYLKTGAVLPDLPLDVSGLLVVPDDFNYATAFRTDASVVDVDVVNDNKITYRLNSLIVPPTLARPMAEVTSTGYQLYTAPTGDVAAVLSVLLRYVAIPLRPVYATTEGALLEINVTNGGTGYSLPPTVTITGGNGTGATATATVAAGVVVSVAINIPGSGYTTQPTILFTPDVLDTLATGAAAVAVWSTDDILYDDAGSVGMEWNETVLNEIIRTAAVDLGLTVKDAAVIQLNQALAAQGV